MKNMDKLIRDYAELIIKEGLNIQKGQRLAINCPVECADFARLCADEAYKAGCREVIMRWRDDHMTRAKYLYADNDVFDQADPWEKIFYDSIADEGVSWLAIHADNPENLKGVDADRIRRAQLSNSLAMKKWRKLEMEKAFPWCVVSVPTKAWSKAVFPEDDEETAVEKMWDAILAACRVDGGNAIADWKAHTAALKKHVEILNEYNFKSLSYKSANGTDISFDLPEGHFWEGGSAVSPAGFEYSANIPTEEVATLPKRDSMNGKIVASKPLCLNGNIIEGFYFIVKDGRIVDVHADQGEEILRDAISVDEGASYFGEVALVPYDSPINKSGILFLNTLFDENAACHFAFGEAYPCIKEADKMSAEELLALGKNSSMTHIDFMVGTEDLEIIGTTHEGEKIQIFKNGNFVF